MFVSPQLKDASSLPGVRELVRLRAGEGDAHLALAHWVLSSKGFAVKTLQKEEVLSGYSHPAHIYALNASQGTKRLYYSTGFASWDMDNSEMIDMMLLEG